MSRMVFYNAGPQRNGDAARDLGGLLRGYRPRVAMVCEVGGDRLQEVPGWGLVRDTSRPGRANLAAYVRDDCHHRKTWWIDHRTRWHRTEHHQNQLHPARSTMVLAVGTVQVLGAHNVPLGTDRTHEGQLEIVQALHVVMAPWKRPRVRDAAPESSLDLMRAMRARPRVLLWDDNAPQATDALGSHYLAPRVNGAVHGDHIDRSVSRRMSVTGTEYVTHAGGVALATDHPWGAFVLHLEKGAVTW